MGRPIRRSPFSIRLSERSYSTLLRQVVCIIPRWEDALRHIRGILKLWLHFPRRCLNYDLWSGR